MFGMAFGGIMDTMERIMEFVATLEAELKTVDEKVEKLNKRRAELSRVAVGLRSAMEKATEMGVTSSSVDAVCQTRTDAIVDIVKAANGACVSAREVTKRLQERGIAGRYDIVVTLLSRLAKRGVLKNVAGHGYAYKSEPNKD
jgi:hypothetical protein